MSVPADDDPTAAVPDDETDVAPYQPTLVSGKWVMLVIAAISIAGAAFGWLWTYDAQRRPRDFWGIRTWKLIGAAPVIRAERLGPEPPSTDGKPKPAMYDGLVVVHYDPGESGRYVVEATKRVENEPGLASQSGSLREALANHRSYNWDSKAGALQRPSWRYALVFSEKPDEQVARETAAEPNRPVPNATAVLLFDADCRFVRVPSVDKPIVLQASVAEQFKKFFELQLPEEPASTKEPAAAAVTSPAASATPSATASGSGSKNP